MIISPLKRTWPFIWTNLNSLHPKIICTKFDWFWSAGYGEEDFLNFSVCLLFCYYLPLEMSYPLHLNRFKSVLSKDNLCQVWSKLAKWFWRRRFLNEHTLFLHFWDYLPFEADLALCFNNLEFPLPKHNLYQVWLHLAFWFWRRGFLKKKFQCIFTLSPLSPLGDGLSPSFEQTWIPFTQGWFVPSLV